LRKSNFFVLFLLGLFGCSSLSEKGIKTATKADTIFYNGDIVTVDDQNRTVEAVAVKNGKILFVGDYEEVMAYKGGKTHLFDLQGKALLPGFIDPHTHIALTQLSLQGLQINPKKCPTGEEALKVLREEVKKGPVLALRYDPSLMKKPAQLGFKSLDAISNTVPILVINASGHIAYGNRAAFKAANITNEAPNPTGGSFQRNKNGELTGIVFELPAIAMLLGGFPQMSQIDFNKVAKDGARYYAENGYTTVTDLALGLPLNTPLHHIESLKSAATRKDATVRIQGYVVYSMIDQLRALQAKNSEAFKILGVKIWSDGSLQGHTGALLKRYKHVDSFGTLNYTPNQLRDIVINAHKQGFQVAVHANGDAAIKETLYAYEHALKASPAEDPRFRIEHATISDRASFAKMKRVKATPSFSVLHIYEWGEVFEDKILGNPRAYEIDSLRTAKEFGVKFSINDDSLGSISPLFLMQIALTRKMDNGRVLNSKQTISIDDAIKALTIYPAWQSFREKEIGSIEVGKFADFVLLDRNPKKVPSNQISTIKVLGTWLGGRRVKTTL
jgi:predicted amidohydrolase YtcJ